MPQEQIKVKPLQIKPKGTPIQRLVRSPRLKTTLTAVVVGALAGFLFFYFTEGRLQDAMEGRDIFRSLLIGGFFGFFVTNSPCARGRC
ncbi:MAG: hypothetical protein R2751_01190 [Bacteroidales bacterium]